MKAPADSYSGRERDDETGFNYHGARYYAPWLGRWVSADPLGIAAGVNLYAYANDNPCVFVDHDGKEPKKPGGTKSAPGRSGSPQRMGTLMHYYSLATLAIRAKAAGLDVDLTGMALTGFEIPTLPGGSRNGKDVGQVDLVLRSESTYHLYDLKPEGTSRDWVNRYVQYFPPVGKGESVQRGTILEEHEEVLAPIFYIDPDTPSSIYFIEFKLPADKGGAKKPGIIEYKYTKFDRSIMNEAFQRQLVESRGFEWSPEVFRELSPAADQIAVDTKVLSPEGSVVYPEIADALLGKWEIAQRDKQVTYWRQLDEAYRQAEINRLYGEEIQMMQMGTLAMTVPTLAPEFEGAGGFAGEGFNVLQAAPEFLTQFLPKFAPIVVPVAAAGASR